jgi:serine/threonine protein kinase
VLNQTVNTAFDTYRAIKLVGEGGSGAVYEARNSDGERVALKCLKPRLPTSRRKRFKNEILFCQSCQHPNIVRVIDTGAVVLDREAVSFYVMPYYAKTLRSLITSRISPEAVVTLFSQLLNGVEAAHLLGVCHRDLKPENILFDEELEQLVVADFGAAEFTADELYTIVETRPKERIGNFQYSAPEQRRAGGKVDHRSDIYALGLILNEMFTGEVPEGSAHRQIASVSAAYSPGAIQLHRSWLREPLPNLPTA